MRRAPLDRSGIILSKGSAGNQRVHTIQQGTCYFHRHAHAFIMRSIHIACHECPPPILATSNHMSGLQGMSGRIYLLSTRPCLFVPPPCRHLPCQKLSYTRGQYPFMASRITIRTRTKFPAVPILISPPYPLMLGGIPPHSRCLSYLWPNRLLNVPTYEFLVNLKNEPLFQGVGARDALSGPAQC